MVVTGAHEAEEFPKKALFLKYFAVLVELLVTDLSAHVCCKEGRFKILGLLLWVLCVSREQDFYKGDVLSLGYIMIKAD